MSNFIKQIISFRMVGIMLDCYFNATLLVDWLLVGMGVKLLFELLELGEELIPLLVK